MEKILLGKPVAQSIIEKTRATLESSAIKPVMSLIRIGHDPASEYYIQNIIKQGTKLGIGFQLEEYPESTGNEDLLKVILQNNINPAVQGIMIQKPLPGHIDDNLINNFINVDKDIDGINPLNLGKVFMEQPAFVPCTAAAVIELIKFYNLATTGKHIVILGRSTVVGIPLLGLLLQKKLWGNATVTVCHSKTNNIKTITQEADIIISAIGKPNFVTGDMMKSDTICIDVGINQVTDESGKDIFVGDFDYNSCFEKAGAITPVPGGIGTITTSILLNNITKAALAQSSYEK